MFYSACWVAAGPSGVGKTQLAAHLATILHGHSAESGGGGGGGGKREDCFVQLQMNQFQDERSIDSLIGPPVGVVGEGQLTGALRRSAAGVPLAGIPPLAGVPLADQPRWHATLLRAHTRAAGLLRGL